MKIGFKGSTIFIHINLSNAVLVELSRLFAVSTDYILGLEHEIVLDLSGVDAEGVRLLNDMLRYIRTKQE